MLHELSNVYIKYSGVLTVLFEWSALFFFYLNFPSNFHGQYPLSYFATLPYTKWAFIIYYFCASVSCWIFVRYYLTRFYRVPTKIFAYSLLTFAAVAWFPFEWEKGIQYTIHLFLAYSTFSTFLVGIYLIGRYNKDKLLKRICEFTAFISTMLGLLVISLPDTMNLVFASEVGAWFIIQLWVLWISYYVSSKKPH